MKMDFSEENKTLKPLKNKLFYLDLKFSKKQDVAALSQDLIQLGAVIERFLSKDIKYVVTDRPNWKPDSKSLENWAPDTPNSTPSPYTLSKCEFGDGDSPFNEGDLKRNHPQTSRGRRLLEQSTKYHKRDGSTDVLENSRQWGIRILSIATVLKWVEKTKKGIQKAVQKKVLHQSQVADSQHVMGVKKLISPFIKVEDKHRRHRTFYKEFTVWPDIAGICNTQISRKSNKLQENVPNIYPHKQEQHITAEGFAAKAHEMFKKRSLKHQVETKRKSYCEICSAPYSNLQQHLVTKCHRSFLSDKTNYGYLNEVISSLPQVDKFLADEHHVSTCSNLSFSKKRKIEIGANTILNVPREERGVKARRRVASNLAHKFELCSITSSGITSTKVNDGKENINNSLEVERIEGSCDSPLECGFPFLEDDDPVETTYEKPTSFPVNQATPNGTGVADACISLVLEEENDTTKGDTSIIFDSIHNISHDRKVLPKVPALETHSLNAINILSPPDSFLCANDDSVVDSCENARTFEHCIQVVECAVAGTDIPDVGDQMIMMKQDNTSIDSLLQIVGCDSAMMPEIAAAICTDVPVVGDRKMTRTDHIAGDDKMIPEIYAATSTSVSVTVEDSKTTKQDVSIEPAHQTVGCDYETVPEISMDEMLSLELLEKSLISTTKNVNIDFEQPSVLGNQVESNNVTNQNTSIILPTSTTEDCKIVPDITSVFPANLNEPVAVSFTNLPLCQTDEKTAFWNLGNTGLDLCESNIGEGLMECNVPDISCHVGNSKRKKENDFSQSFNDCAECVRENTEFHPLNLCVRQSNAIVNGEPVANNCSWAKEFAMHNYSLTPAKRRLRGSSSQPRKVRILSDRSMLTIFNSDDDKLEFSGFKSDDRNKSSDLSYVEVSVPSEELGSDELTFQYEMNSECTSSEVDNKWDVSLAEFIERQVFEKPQSSCTKYKVQPVDILPMDLSSNSADIGYYTAGNRPP